MAEAADVQRQQMVQNAQTRSDAFTVLSLDVVWTAEFAAHRWISELPRDRFGLSGFVKLLGADVFGEVADRRGAGKSRTPSVKAATV